jgi:hypothetical protein
MVGVIVSLLPFAVVTILWILLMRFLQARRANDSLGQEFEPRSESVETNDGRPRAGTIHTYRDPDVLESDTLRFPLVAVLVFVGLFAFILAHFTWAERGEGAVVVALFLGVLYLSDRRYRYGACGEIRLSDDGTCELETKRRVIRLHVNQIESVKSISDPDSRADYSLRYQGGSVPVTNGMTGFGDFLARLKTLNPAVDLTGFPADALPAGVPKTKEGWSVTRLFRIVLFPLIVIAMLVYLASQTLMGN